MCHPVSSLPLTVVACGDAPVVALDGDGSAYSCPPPYLRLSGVAGVGAAGLRLHASTLPPSAHGVGGDTTGWSLSFWVWLWDGPTGDFRALMHKGHGDDNRTPSVWLLPNDMRLALRVSSAVQANLGAESVGALPLRTWTHVALVLSNSTAAGLSWDLYLNGELDVHLQFGDAVLANDGPLRLGRDSWERGTRALVSGVSVWGVALSPAHVAVDYRSGLQLHSEKFFRAALAAPPTQDNAPLLRLYDGVFRACEMVARWPAPAPLNPEAEAVVAGALTMLQSCEVEYVTAMEVRGYCPCVCGCEMGVCGVRWLLCECCDVCVFLLVHVCDSA